MNQDPKARFGTGAVIAFFVTVWVALGLCYLALVPGKDADAWRTDAIDAKEPCRPQAIVVDSFRKVSCDHPEHRMYMEPLAAFVEKKTEDSLPMVTENHWVARCACRTQIQDEMEMSTCDREEHGAVQDARRLLDELRKFEKERRSSDELVTQEKKK